MSLRNRPTRVMRESVADLSNAPLCPKVFRSASSGFCVNRHGSELEDAGIAYQFVRLALVPEYHWATIVEFDRRGGDYDNRKSGDQRGRGESEIEPPLSDHRWTILSRCGDVEEREVIDRPHSQSRTATSVTPGTTISSDIAGLLPAPPQLLHVLVTKVLDRPYRKRIRAC